MLRKDVPFLIRIRVWRWEIGPIVYIDIDVATDCQQAEEKRTPDIRRGNFVN